MFSDNHPKGPVRNSVGSTVPAPMMGEFGVQAFSPSGALPGTRASRTMSMTRGEYDMEMWSELSGYVL